MIIRTVNLTRKYRLGNSTIEAVKDVNLEIESTQFVAIVGPSGSGKSTLLNLIGLIDYPTSGKVYFQNEDASLLSAKKRRQIRFQNIGFIFQSFNLIPTLTALENVELPMAFAQRAQEAQRTEAINLLKTVGLSHRLNHKPREMSVGEMQRVAIARSLAHHPSLILADEPTGELDSKTGSEIIKLLLYLCRQRNTTVIAATHDEKMADVANEKYRIQDGVIVSHEQS